MAAIRQRQGKWRAEVRMLGVYDSDTFDTKQAAKAWATRREAEIHGGRRGEVPNLTVKDLFERYESKVSAGKKGKRWESIRLKALGRDRIAQVRLKALDTPHVADWQERRLEAVSSASVRRERNLLNNVFNIAVKEWKWLRRNPFEGVRRPRDGKARRRIASPDEVKKLTAEPDNLTRAIIIALEAGLRAGEIPRAEVNGKVAFLADTKNGEVREVPLSSTAVEQFRAGVNLTASSISTLFARRCDDLKIRGLTFHDLRATACTRLSKVLNPLQLARMMGWKDLKMAMVYYREATEDIADLLNN
jgi:integrase